jgi:hypothetical protein
MVAAVPCEMCGQHLSDSALMPDQVRSTVMIDHAGVFSGKSNRLVRGLLCVTCNSARLHPNNPFGPEELAYLDRAWYLTGGREFRRDLHVKRGAARQ